MWINYKDSEVNVFHPICEEALNRAIDELGLNSTYEVLHHEYTGSLEMDFVIQNKGTKRYLCVIEVKKHPSDVYSTRYQYQTMSYVQMNEGKNENTFYILTNLEKALSFKYDKEMPNVYQQVLEPGVENIGDFEFTTKASHLKSLKDYFKKKILDFVRSKFKYLLTLDRFANHIISIEDNRLQWKTDLAVLGYEYIRGSLNAVNRHELNDIRIYRSGIEQICRAGSKLNFKNIFNYNNEIYEKHISVDNQTLTDIYDLGNTHISGDIVANLMHQIVSTGKEHLGEVPTDLELGRVLTVLAESVNDSEWKSEDTLADLAAGSGNLLSAGIEIINIDSNQIWANDINTKLLELLSLRLGLKYVTTINKDSSPLVSCRSISDIDLTEMEKVKMLLLNPPFVAGIYSNSQKKQIFNRIKDIKESNPATDSGQMPLEGAFLELISLIAKKGTIIGCVFPKNHLTGRGKESKIIRKLLVEELGLKIIFNYPRSGVFENVTKDTFVFVGIIGEKPEKVKFITSFTDISDINLIRFDSSLKLIKDQDFASIMPGIEAKIVEREDLIKNIDDGWRGVSSSLEQATNFVADNLSSDNNKNKKMMELKSFIEEKSIPFKRGKAGNNGLSDLLFIETNSLIHQKAREENLTVLKSLRKAKSNEIILDESYDEFLTYKGEDKDKIKNVVQAFERLPVKLGKQKKNTKTTQDILDILKSESTNYFLGSCVLIPRNIRKMGRVYVSKESMYVSTNFVVLSELDIDQALLIASWVSTIFYQLICEVSSKDQEGTRKMEVKDIGKTYIPDFSKISADDKDVLIEAVRKIEFIDLQAPEIREIDLLWAKILFGDKSKLYLEEANDLLELLANLRNN